VTKLLNACLDLRQVSWAKRPLSVANSTQLGSGMGEITNSVEETDKI